MKARIPPKHILSKQQRQACVEYEQLSEENINRIFKLFCYCLNCDFKFGADRLSRLCHSVEELAEMNKTKIGSDKNEVTDEELALINNYTRRALSKDEVYVFSVILCDNDIDRDGDRFTVEALFELEKLFVGKTGFFDHDPSAKNQTARIFDCHVEAVQGQKTTAGDDYFRLKARAYMPVSEKNKDVILLLDSGIVKEVSVRCAVEEVVCSICGKNIDLCSHRKGETYGSKLCCGELINPSDAYEWSFVAVPWRY